MRFRTLHEELAMRRWMISMVAVFAMAVVISGFENAGKCGMCSDAPKTCSKCHASVKCEDMAAKCSGCGKLVRCGDMNMKCAGCHKEVKCASCKDGKCPGCGKAMACETKCACGKTVKCTGMCEKCASMKT